MLLELTALDDPTTPGHVLRHIASRATSPTHTSAWGPYPSAPTTIARVLAHPSTPHDVVATLTLPDATSSVTGLDSPASTPQTRARVLAAVPERALVDLALMDARHRHHDDIHAALHVRAADTDTLNLFTPTAPGYRDAPPLSVRRVAEMSPRATSGDLREAVTTSLHAKQLRPGCDTTPWDAVTIAEALTRLIVHPNTPPDLLPALSEQLEHAVRCTTEISVDGNLVKYLQWWHVAYPMARNPDLRDYVRSTSVDHLRRNADRDQSVTAHALAHHLAPLVRPLWADPDLTRVALSLWTGFCGTVDDLVATATTVAA